MAYIITIEKETFEKTTEIPPGKLHLKIHERLPNENYLSVEEYAWIDNPNKEPVIKTTKRSEGIYTQTVEDLDIASVIIAVNKLDKEKAK